MKITVNRESFINLMDRLSRGLEKVIIPINGSFLFRIEDNKCYGYCKNGKFEIKGFIQVDSDEDHSFCVPAKIFHDTVKLLGSFEDIIIKNSQNDKVFKSTITVKGGKKRYDIIGWDPNDFSIMGMPEGSPISEVSAEAFTTSMKNVVGVVKDDIRGGLAGVSIMNNKETGKVEIWGANQQTVGCMTLSSMQKVVNSIIPKNIAAALDSITTSPNMEIHTSNDRVRFTCGSYSLTGMLIDEKVLNFEKFWTDAKFDKYIVVDRLDFLGALKRLKLYSLSEYNSMVFDIKDDQLIMTSESEGKDLLATEEFDIENFGCEFTVKFNPGYIIDAIQKSSSDKLVFHFAGKFNHLYISEHENAIEPEQRWCVPPINN